MKHDTHRFYRCSATAIIVFVVFAMMLYALSPAMALPGHTSGTEPVTYSDDGETLEGASDGEGDRSLTTIDGDMVIDEDTNLRDGTWVVNGNVKVTGATLTLDNVDFTFQNLSPRSSVSFEVESGSVLRCRNSTVLGKSMGVVMYLEGRIEVYDSSLTSELLSGGQGLISSRGGNVTLENTTLTRFNVQSNNNIIVRRCQFWNYTKAVSIFYGWPTQGATYTVMVENSTFHDAGNSDSGVQMGGPGQLNVNCYITVRNCTFNSVGKAIELSMFYQRGNVTIEDNTIEDSVSGINMMNVGPMVTCRNNTIDATEGIVLVNQEQMVPFIYDETVRARQYGLKLTVTIQDWIISGLDIEAAVPIRCEKAHLTVVNSSLDPSGTLHVTDGTMTLTNCSHGYRGLVSGEESWIREYLPMAFNVSRWTCGSAIVKGLVEILDENGTRLAVKPHTVATTVLLIHWQVTVNGSTLSHTAHGSFWLEDWEFTTAPFDLAADAFQELEFQDDYVPNVTVECPSEGDLIKGVQVELDGTFLEVGTGVLSVLVRCDDGAWVEATLPSAAKWNCILIIPCDGVHVLSVAVEDLAGNVGIASIRVTTDDTPPEIEVLEPEPKVNDPEVTLLVRTEVGAQAFVDGVEVTVWPDGTFRRDLQLSGGVEAVHIRVVDPAGNVNETTYSIELDLTPSLVAVDVPEDGEWLASTTVHVSGIVEGEATVLVNGLEPNREGQSWWLDLTADEGDLKITVIAADPTGNTATVEVTVHIDLTRPSLQVTSPEDGTIFNNSIVNITGWATDLSPVTVKVNGEIATMDGHDWWCLLELEEGETVVTVVTRDKAGNERDAELTVLCDSQAPTVTTILSVGGDSHEPGASVLANHTNVDLVIDVDEPCVLVIAGLGTYDLSPGENTLGLDLPADAGTWLNLTLTDLAGNAAIGASFHVVTDLTPPSLELIEPTEDTTLRQAVVKLVATTDVDATATVDGKSSPVSAEGRFSVELELQEGTNEIVLTVVDQAGNMATLTVELTYEPVDTTGNDDGSNATVLVVIVISVLAALGTLMAWHKWRQ